MAINRNFCRRANGWCLAFGAIIMAWAISGTSQAAILLDTELVERSVVFVFYPVKHDDGTEDLSAGTGFLVDVPLRSDPSRRHRLLVTARHIVEPTWRGCGGRNPVQASVRVNLKQVKPDGLGIAALTIDLAKNRASTYATGGERDDVAVLLLPPSFQADTLDIRSIPISMFATPTEVQRVSIGDNVVSAGLLPVFPGAKRNYPIFKFGQLSSVPREPIAITCRDRRGAPMLGPGGAFLGTAADVWLLAIPLGGGSSGSPIFVAPPGARGAGDGMTFRAQFGPGREMLIGVQSLTLDGSVGGMTPVEALYSVISAMNLPDADLSRGTRPARR